jgi:ubiquinone/menaquinone biosynthesis C-methylase UbiE
MSLEKERQFHDYWAENINLDTLKAEDYFEAVTAPENRFILQHLGDIQGKYLLDLGCGAGENSVYFAKQGAHCLAVDYAPKMVELALQLAAQNGVKIEGAVANAMDLHFPDHSFDLVYASNLLHHIPDPKVTIQEMYRVLKPGGKACFWDPLKHNPIINIYRKIATKVRTEDEQPLDIKIINDVRKLFNQVEYDTFWLGSLWIFLQFYLIEKVNPNEERYWKKIILEKDRLTPIYQKLESLDFFLKKIPGMKRFAWNIAVVATK